MMYRLKSFYHRHVKRNTATYRRLITLSIRCQTPLCSCSEVTSVRHFITAYYLRHDEHLEYFRPTYSRFHATLVALNKNVRSLKYKPSKTCIMCGMPIATHTILLGNFFSSTNEWHFYSVNPAYRYHYSCSGSFRLLYQVPYHPIWSVYSGLIHQHKGERYTHINRCTWLHNEDHHTQITHRNWFHNEDHHTRITHHTWLHKAHAYYSFLDTSCWLLFLIQLRLCHTRP